MTNKLEKLKKEMEEAIDAARNAYGANKVVKNAANDIPKATATAYNVRSNLTAFAAIKAIYAYETELNKNNDK
jgi:hypothetical protein